MKTLSISYSAAVAYESGVPEQVDRAVASFLGYPRPPATKRMQLGRVWDKKWNEETLETGQPPVMFGYTLPVNLAPQRFFKMVIYEDSKVRMVLSGVEDAGGGKYIGENKCGTTPLSYYMSSYQGDVYGIGRPQARVVVFNVFNPFTREVKVGIKHINKKSIEVAKQWLINVGDAFIADQESVDARWWREEVKQTELIR